MRTNHRAEIVAELLRRANLCLLTPVGLIFGAHVPLPPGSRAVVGYGCGSLYVIAARAAAHLDIGAPLSSREEAVL